MLLSPSRTPSFSGRSVLAAVFAQLPAPPTTGQGRWSCPVWRRSPPVGAAAKWSAAKLVAVAGAQVLSAGQG